MSFDEPKPEVTTVDRNPERDYAGADRLGRILSITPRQVRRLAADRVIRREQAGPFKGLFRILPAVDRYIDHVTKRRSAKAERRDELQARILQRRLDAEQPNTIPSVEALAVIDHVTNAFGLALDEIGRQAADVVEDPARAAAAIQQTKVELANRFDRQRQRLVTGKAK